MSYWRPGKKKKSVPYIYSASTSFFTAARGAPQTMWLQAEQPPAPELKDLGLAIEPIIGHRIFAVEIQVTTGRPVLVSMNGCWWPKRRALQAVCGDNVFADHNAPKANCTCGIYAWNVNRLASDVLTAEVYLWGDVLICDFGYRAEFAYPKSLHITNPGTRVAERIRAELEEDYGVPVTMGPAVSLETELPPFPGSNPT